MSTAYTFDNLPAAQEFAARGGQLIKLADVYVVVIEDGKGNVKPAKMQQMVWRENG